MGGEARRTRSSQVAEIPRTSIRASTRVTALNELGNRRSIHLSYGGDASNYLKLYDSRGRVS